MVLTKPTVLMVVCSMLMLLCSITAASDCQSIKLRKKELSVYFHDTLNVTDFLLIERPRAITTREAPFGSLFLTNDPVTEGPDPASPRLGNLTATFFASVIPYGSDYLSSVVVTFFNNSSPSNTELRGLHGTITSTGTTVISDPQPQPITGGTDSFAFVLGTLTMVPIDSSTFTQLLRLDLVLYWPPYSS